MDRLTHEHSNGINTGAWSPNKKQELVEQLAEYERTGLTPKMIEELKKSEVAAQKVAMEHAIELDELKEFISNLPALATAVPAAVMEPEWILVEERLPDNPEKMVLVQVSGRPVKNIRLENAMMLGVYVPEEGWILEMYPEWEGANNGVVAWMPLPQPYRPQLLKEAGKDAGAGAVQGGLLPAT